MSNPSHPASDFRNWASRQWESTRSVKKDLRWASENWTAESEPDLACGYYGKVPSLITELRIQLTHKPKVNLTYSINYQIYLTISIIYRHGAFIAELCPLGNPRKSTTEACRKNKIIQCLFFTDRSSLIVSFSRCSSAIYGCRCCADCCAVLCGTRHEGWEGAWDASRRKRSSKECYQQRVNPGSKGRRSRGAETIFEAAKAQRHEKESSKNTTAEQVQEKLIRTCNSAFLSSLSGSPSELMKDFLGMNTIDHKYTTKTMILNDCRALVDFRNLLLFNVSAKTWSQ